MADAVFDDPRLAAIYDATANVAELTRSTTDIPGVGRVTDRVQVTDLAGDGELVTFESPNLFEAGFAVDDVRDAPDRPGREPVFIARRADPPPPVDQAS